MSWYGKGIQVFKQKEFEIVYILSSDYPTSKLCEMMNINRSGFYRWRDRMKQPNEKND